MISFVRGVLAGVEEDKVIIDVGGIGYNVFVSASTSAKLPPEGHEVKLYTYMNVKEDLMQLYGFLIRDELQVFRLIIGVNGIGPKGGLGILSQLTPDDLRFAVASKDVKAISAAPGIGKKTAEKLILELKDKLSMEDVLNHATEEEHTVNNASMNYEVQSEAVQALAALGYGNTEALRAVKQVEIEEDTSVEIVLKKALKFLM